MRRFPTTESEVMALAERIIYGVTEHPEDFPGIDPAALTDQLAAFQQKNAEQQSAAAAARSATVAKQDSYQSLLDLLAAALKRAEADCLAAPTKLAEIGWRSRRTGGKLSPPAMGLNLRAMTQSNGTLELSWQKNPSRSGGPVRCWLVQSRGFDADGTPQPWRLVDIAYDTLLILTQPPAGKSEYRVIASNAAGNSLPGNLATARA